MENISDILKKHWGFSTFRPLQEEIINSVLEGKDTLALLPTGGGKSMRIILTILLLPALAVAVLLLAGWYLCKRSSPFYVPPRNCSGATITTWPKIQNRMCHARAFTVAARPSWSASELN